MAAVRPFLEQAAPAGENDAVHEALELSAETAAALEAANGPTLGSLDAASSDRVTAIAVARSHSELVATAWTRSAVYDALVGNSYRVVERIGDDGSRTVRIVLERPPARAPDANDPRFPIAPWSPVTEQDVYKKGVNILSWTSKMAAPSFSLPAGPLFAGGSCPGSHAGQSIVPAETLLSAAARVADVTGAPVRLSQAICQVCYAEGGQYTTGNVQIAQVLRFIWTRDALRVADAGLWSPHSGTAPPPALLAWIDTMTYAITHADFLLDGGKVAKHHYEPERFEGRFFRIHDSGDFFSPGYIWAWKQVALRLPDITFWAPSRYWALGRAAIADVNAINDPSGNLVIRPSAFHVNEPPPRALGPGWAEGSAAFALSQRDEGAARGDFDFGCNTYSVVWIRPELVINYTTH